MEPPDDVLDTVAAWAREEEGVRGAVLVGSRAEPGNRVDALSDHDIVLFVRDPSRYAEDEGWLEAFGPVLVTLRDGYELAGRRVTTRLVQYGDGTKIDFTLYDVDHLEGPDRNAGLSEVLDAGGRVLVDKDDRLSGLPQPTREPHVPEPPTEPEYREVVNEFWWETTYVAKCLARGELLPARYSAERVMRFRCLVPMLTWYAEGLHGWDEPLGPHGRGAADLLSAEDRRRLEATFAGSDLEGNWEALFAATAFFADMARAVAEELGFTEMDELGRAVEEHLRRIRTMELADPAEG